MGLQDRDYYRDPGGGDGLWGLDLTPVVKYLLFLNIAVFLAQIFITRNPSADAVAEYQQISRDLVKLYKAEQDDDARPAAKSDDEEAKVAQTREEKKKELQKRLQDVILEGGLPGHRVSLVEQWFALDTEKTIFHGQVWRLFTHAFCHERHGLGHIFFNMLALWWCGVVLESRLGSKEFLLFYVTAIAIAGLAYLGLDLYMGPKHYGRAMGASGAVMAAFMLYACYYPYNTILVFWVIPVQIRWVALIYFLWDLHPVLLVLSGEQVFTGIAHAAHLGGLAFGFCYWRFDWRLDTLADRTAPRLPRRRRPRLRVVRAEDDEPATVPIGLPNRVDEILKKVHDHGKESLSEDEVALLNEASERLKRSRRS
jgi:membrane associated rhomboid family serine protease